MICFIINAFFENPPRLNRNLEFQDGPLDFIRKPFRPNDRNMSTQHIATLLARLATML